MPPLVHAPLLLPVCARGGSAALAERRRPDNVDASSGASRGCDAEARAGIRAHEALSQEESDQSIVMMLLFTSAADAEHQRRLERVRDEAPREPMALAHDAHSAGTQLVCEGV